MLKEDLAAMGIKDGCWHQKTLDRYMYGTSVYVTSRINLYIRELRPFLCTFG